MNRSRPSRRPAGMFPLIVFVCDHNSDKPRANRFASIGIVALTVDAALTTMATSGLRDPFTLTRDSDVDLSPSDLTVILSLAVYERAVSYEHQCDQDGKECSMFCPSVDPEQMIDSSR